MNSGKCCIIRHRARRHRTTPSSHEGENAQVIPGAVVAVLSQSAKYWQIDVISWTGRWHIAQCNRRSYVESGCAWSVSEWCYRLSHFLLLWRFEYATVLCRNMETEDVTEIAETTNRWVSVWSVATAVLREFPPPVAFGHLVVNDILQEAINVWVEPCGFAGTCL